jgi:putative restriction endonuclease
VQGHILNTDFDWYTFLAAQEDLDEVNFWRPGRQRMVAKRGAPVIFKLKSPQNAICGFGFFSRYERLPIWLAWDLFGRANGVATQAELSARLDRIAGRNTIDMGSDPHVGCIAITQPTFFPPDEWVEMPVDWAPNIVTGKNYDLAVGEGQRIWSQCLEAYSRLIDDSDEIADTLEPARRGNPVMVRPRLGQASFRLDVQDAYSGRCAVTGEHSLPVLEAAHVTPWGEGGPHRVSNGVFLRSDLHKLFDRGYVTIADDATLVVGDALKDEWNNGRAYYELAGRKLAEPAIEEQRLDRDRLAWHREAVFIG